MRFLFLSTDYPEFLSWLYSQSPRLKHRSYGEQLRVRRESLFGFADFRSSNLGKLGHEAWDIHINNDYMQEAWARQHRFETAPFRPWRFRWRRGFVPWLSRSGGRRCFYAVLGAQIKYYKPDVLLNHAVEEIDSSFLREMKPYMGLLVGQHSATPLPDSVDWGCYDLMLSSFRPTVEWFRQRGVPARFHRLGFGQRVLTDLNSGVKRIPVSFVGSFARIHGSRTAFLEQLCSQLSLKIWAPREHILSVPSAVRSSYMGPAWGTEMYRVLRDSQITLNHHGDIAPYANNCRLYEATGVGTLLLTDWKQDLHQILEPGREVVAYHDAGDCAEKIEYYLRHKKEAESIAARGQRRTLQEHTYTHRMQELVDIVRQTSRR